MSFLYVALGGAVGATFRYLISLVPLRTGFPFLTLLTNLLGAVFVGIIVGLSTNNKAFSENKVLFLKVGLCGGFTTFSTFSLEAVQLMDSGKYMLFGTYVLSSVVLCILGVVLGRTISSVIA